MYIKEVELDNFKSFKGRNTIRFSKGLTIIYGPNGSGKSNIVDALLFVFGESSKKEMRSEVLTDFIFKDPSIDLAKVIVKLDNSDKRIANMPEEIIISRAVNKKGASAFRLNGKKVPRESIIDFLAQLRLEEKLNIIPQGKIIELIEMKPDEIALLVKSLAGIEAFERKREKAEEELRKYQDNLEKVEIIKSQKTKELQEIEQEKKKADDYNELKKQLDVTNYKILKIELLDLQKTYNQLNEAREKLNSEINVLKGKEKELENLIESLRKEIEKKEKDKEEKGGKELERLNTKKVFLEEDLIRTEARISALEERVKQLQQEIENINAEFEKYNKEKERLEKELNEARESKVVLEGKQKDIDEKLKKEKEKRKRKEEIEKEIKELDEKIIKLNKVLAERAIIIEKERRLEEIEKELNSLLLKIKEQKEKIDQLSSDLSITEKELKEIKGKIAIVESEYKEAQAREEIYNAIKDIKGVVGPVYKLFKIKKPELATAIVRAAGSRLGLIVVENEKVAEEAIRTLASKRVGYASFIPLTKILNFKEKIIRLDEGSLGRAVDFIEYNPEVENIMNFVFGDTQIFERFEQAVRASTRAVTKEGIVVEKSGIIHGGYTREFEERERQIVIEQEIEELKNKEKELNERETIQKGELAKLQAEIAVNEEKRKQLLEEKTKLETELNNYKDIEGLDILQLEKRREELQKELEGLMEIKDEVLTSELNIIGKELTEIQEKIKNHERQLNSFILPYIDTLEKRKKNLEKELESIKSELETKKNNINSIKEELENTNKQFNELDSHLKDLSESLNQLNKQLNEALKELDNIRKTSSLKGQELSKLEYKLGEINAKIEGLNQQIAEIKYKEEPKENETISELKELKQKLIEKINAIGKINELATEKYDQLKKEIEDIEKEENKLNEEKQKIEALINEINQKREAAFMQTLNAINESFSYLIKLLFNGEGMLVPISDTDKVDGGIRIKIEISNKHITSLHMLSGGEKSLVSLSLALSLSKVIDAPFFIFDEIDAALDSENINKIFSIIKQLSSSRQIIAISHNEVSASYADALIGVTMVKGESKCFSIERKEEVSKLLNTT